MIVKIHKTQEGRIILAVCDKEIIGKKYEENGIQLDLKSEFYKGKEIEEEKVKELFKKASLFPYDYGI